MRTLVVVCILGLALASPLAARAQQDRPRPDKPRPHVSQAELQRAEGHLKAAGSDPGPVDGILTAETEAALFAYQRVQGLWPTGVLDEPTAQRLLSDRIEGPSSIIPEIVPPSPEMPVPPAP